MRIVACIAFFLAAATPALADRADADACSVKLAGLALDTYKNSINEAARGRTLRQAIGGYLEPLYKAGKVTEADARKHGYAAAMCVRLVHRQNRKREPIQATLPASHGTRAAAARVATTKAATAAPKATTPKGGRGRLFARNDDDKDKED